MRTQKSISRFPALPNSLSPTWNDTVILSSLCNCSWKHSRPWAGSWILWAVTTESSPVAARSSDEAEGNCILGIWCVCCRCNSQFKAKVEAVVVECVEVCDPLQCSLLLSICCRPNLDLGDKLRLHKLLASATRGGWPRATFDLVALEIPDTQSALLTEGAWAPGCKDPTRTLE